MVPQRFANTQKGFIALLSVLILSAVATAIAVSLLFLGTTASQTIRTREASLGARELANACADEALEQIRESTSFTGTNSLTIGGGSCDYTVTAQSGENRTITAVGTLNTVVRKISITIDQINPTIRVTQWEEVP